MNQQKLEKALRDIAQVLNETGSTTTHDRAGDRNRARFALKRITLITYDTLKEIDDGRRQSR
jgi:hypothetical protein